MIVVRNAFVGVILSTALFFNVQPGRAQQTSPTSTTVPIIITHSVDTSKAQVGDPVTAKTIQIVSLPDGSEIPKGAALLGHVTAARAFSFDQTPYAVQQPSVLSIRFDTVMTKTATMKVLMSVRAMADRIDSVDAVTPHYTDEHDIVGTMVQVGGDSFRRHEMPVASEQGDIVGYNRKDGVFAHLLPSEYTSRYSHFQCEGTDTEQSVAIFSAGACGLYGFGDTYMAENGLGKELGTFRLESRRHSVKLYAQSTALLQIISFHR